MKKVRFTLLAMLFVPVLCLAQDTFKLNTEFRGEGPVCRTIQAAIDVANGGNLQAADKILEAYVKDGSCGIVSDVILIYSREVYRYGEFRVYEGRMLGRTVFSPTLARAEDEQGL